ncbi:uncharacterized protein FA14DRAFT_155858 [Meira miltonrushii]|uniref:Glucosidase 2 subunit beta n=1 Tax=Meira miltonrushii TaxID=1280837 RepID=A0A316V6D7_9BASI|nr:uncharacterized protein FA14DRAFT_155858 [Meira miltonrushii]PWN33159.1 hypothetical protein FA14DRAFT_155858 [Meira miltonrushii]
MRFVRGPLLALVWTALSLHAIDGVNADIRGVSPEDAHLYSVAQTGKGTWKCLQSGEEIPASSINDDYCDCKDGSDEPGTSACANSSFHCTNVGHIPSKILSSRVNDGICDPECCDGSDEYDGKVHCPNVCEKIGKQYRKAKQESENIRRAGSKIREKYIHDRSKALESLTADVARLEIEVEVAREREQRAKEALDAAEQMDQHVIERKKASPLYQTLKSHQSALKVLTNRQKSLQTELERLTDLLDDLAKGYNPNYQDMAVKGAVMAYRSWRRGDEESDDGQDGEESSAAKANQVSIDDEEPKTLNELKKEDAEYSSSKIEDMIERDPLSMMDDNQYKGSGRSDESGILFRIHEYLPDAIVPYFEAGVDTFLDLLLKANIITEVKRSKTRRAGDSASEGEAENVLAARSAHKTAEQALRDAQSDLTKKQNDLSHSPEKWGQEGEFKALENVCVSKNMGEYIYEFCFFKNATQKPTRGHGDVSLGRWGRFAPKDSSVQPDQPEFYLRQIYDNGQRCWNGPDRSLIVDFVCAPENALLDVFEGEKCIYEAKVSTPAICLPLDAEKAPAHVHIKDEL